MQRVQEERVVCNDHMQIMIKGKRTKRQRLPSPLRLAMSSSTSSSGSGGFDLATPTTATATSPTALNEFRSRRTTPEVEDNNDEDMANCLILLAQGHRHHHHHHHLHHNQSNKATTQSPKHMAGPSNNKAGLYLYECKTCNRCFPSFQALGGHRASHKKPKTNSAPEEKQAVTTSTSTFVNERDNYKYHDNKPASTTLTLQIPNRSLYSSSTMATTPTTKSKVHECSICGAEFTSGQALGGHMRRHRGVLSMSAATTSSSMSGANVNGIGGSFDESQEAKKPKSVLKLDLNLPAPEDDHREPNKFSFQAKEKVIVFSATSLVDCHY